MPEVTLRLVACAATPAVRQAVCGVDDEPDDSGLRAARALPDSAGWGPADAWLAGPSRAAVQTARAAGREPTVVPALADTDYGRWAGRGVADLAATEPDAVRQWLSDPAAAPHGGESPDTVRVRVAGWLGSLVPESGVIVAFAPAAVVRAALLHALDMPAAATFQLDVAPLSVARLRWRAGRWTWHLLPG